MAPRSVTRVSIGPPGVTEAGVVRNSSGGHCSEGPTIYREIEVRRSGCGEVVITAGMHLVQQHQQTIQIDRFKQGPDRTKPRLEGSVFRVSCKNDDGNGGELGVFQTEPLFPKTRSPCRAS
jgi:hypothetical protein